MTWRCSSCQHQNLGRHKACQQCGNPKDESEQYEMPSQRASVTDAALLRMAEAGPNWRCAYCGSDQRKADASCAQCGASSEHGQLLTPNRPVRARPSWWRKHRIAIIVVAALVVIPIACWTYLHRTRTFDAKVVDARWTQTISVERYQIWSRDGWRDTQPPDAFDVVSKGQQIHHYDKVLDGYDTEHYTEQVACGQDCYTEAESCHEECDDNGNGFSSCHTECTGGGQKCTTRYCSEPRTRQVPRYRDEPRYAEAIAYQIWDWGHHRSIDASGTGVAGLRWPDPSEVKLGVGLGPREEERETRFGTYVVTLAYDGSSKLTFEVTADELPKFEIGTRHQLRIKRGEQTRVDGQLVKPTDP